jgi:hypothetical protein
LGLRGQRQQRPRRVDSRRGRGRRRRSPAAAVAWAASAAAEGPTSPPPAAHSGGGGGAGDIFVMAGASLGRRHPCRAFQNKSYSIAGILVLATSSSGIRGRCWLPRRHMFAPMWKTQDELLTSPADQGSIYVDEYSAATLIFATGGAHEKRRAKSPQFLRDSLAGGSRRNGDRGRACCCPRSERARAAYTSCSAGERICLFRSLHLLA